MNIEVTNQTFYKVFNSFNKERVENTELTHKQYYYSKNLDQKGVTIYNYVTRVTQYYLTDINV